MVAGAFIVAATGAGGLRAVYSVAINPPDPTIALAMWFGEAHPDAVVLALDAPGRMAWFSGRPVLAADGLTQDYGFAATLEEQGMPAVARSRGVTHVLSYTVDFDLPWAKIEADEASGDVTVRFVAPGRGADAGTLVLREPIRRLTDFQPDGEDVAAIYPLK
jgi:hypothetical protein